MSAHVHAYLPRVDGVARCVDGDSVLADEGDGRWVEQIEQTTATRVDDAEPRIARDRQRLKIAEENRTKLAEWALRDYLNAITAAQLRAVEFVYTPTFRSAGATAMHVGIASYLERQFGAAPPAPKVEKLRRRVALALETANLPESWLELLEEPIPHPRDHVAQTADPDEAAETFIEPLAPHAPGGLAPVEYGEPDLVDEARRIFAGDLKDGVTPSGGPA